MISPVLANLFMHYAFDRWMKTQFPDNPWARYAEDGLIHCRTKDEALHVLGKLAEWMKECNLELHSEKTKIIYCKDANRKGKYEHTSFDFLGYTLKDKTVQKQKLNLFCRL